MCLSIEILKRFNEFIALSTKSCTLLFLFVCMNITTHKQKLLDLNMRATIHFFALFMGSPLANLYHNDIETS